MKNIQVEKIISGGQTGADQAGLDAAMALGIAHGGWVPKGRRTEEGPLSMLYEMWEMESEEYNKRTKRNILDSDGTFIASHGALTGGSLLTHVLAARHYRPCLHIDFAATSMHIACEDLENWLADNAIRILNVAGPRRSSDSAIYGVVKKILLAVLLPVPDVK
jgi:hypothetical protein